jgi:glycerophosphoryl diester phosphodiesterase
MHAEGKLALSASKLLHLDRPLIIGHRGYCQFAPENTLPSFRLAVLAGVDMVEMDCRMSCDGQWVVIHDGELDRTTDARQRWKRRHNRVGTKTAAEIQSLDAGSWFDEQFSDTKVPLLGEAMDSLQHGAVALIERKDGSATACAEFLRARGHHDDLIIQSFDWHFLRQLHELMPHQILGALGPPSLLANGRRPAALVRQLTDSWIAQAQKTGAKVIVWSRWLTRRSIRHAHKCGLGVWVYTINRPDLANRLLKRGVKGLITDNPSLLWRAIALKKKRRPSPLAKLKGLRHRLVRRKNPG